MYVYILSNYTNSTIYVGVSNDLRRRIFEHRNHLDPKSFSTKYNTTKLVYYDYVDDAYSAIEREKQIKGWNRARKNKLITQMNPHWDDLYDVIME